MSRRIATEPRRRYGTPSSSASTSSTRPTRTAPTSARTLIAEALHPYPDDLVIATKGGLERTGPGRWPTNGRPEHLRDACEGSLRRLRLDQIPLYQFHRPDPDVPLEDSIGALAELKDAGKVRHIGVCNVTEAQLRRAQRVTPIVSVQNRYNVTDRSSEALVDLCEQEQLAFLPWAPILDLDRVPLVNEVAERHGATPTSRPRVAARSITGNVADPGHGLGRAPREQRGGRIGRSGSRGGRRTQRALGRSPQGGRPKPRAHSLAAASPSVDSGDRLAPMGASTADSTSGAGRHDSAVPSSFTEHHRGGPDAPDFRLGGTMGVFPALGVTPGLGRRPYGLSPCAGLTPFPEHDIRSERHDQR